MNISDAEWRILHVIWERKSATASDVIEEVIPETGWSHRTVRTLLARLVEKQALSTQKKGNRYLYRARITRSRCVREETRSFLEKVFDGDTGEMLVHFVRNAKITEDQIQELRQMLDKKQNQGDDQ